MSNFVINFHRNDPDQVYDSQPLLLFLQPNLNHKEHPCENGKQSF